jgi:DNA topoisomerase-2
MATATKKATPKAKPKAKPKPRATKAKATKPTKDASAKPTNAEAANAPKGSTQATANDYERLSARDHVLRRPGMYIGSTKSQTAVKWIHDSDGSASKQTVTYVPGLVKLFDEILVNAADNVHRCPTTANIHVTADAETGTFSVRNDGTGVPVVMHEKENMWVPELVFGQLLTGSNFTDKAENFTGGRHGYGAKLTNIFSTRFEVETFDSRSRSLFKQSWNKLIPTGPAQVTPVDNNHPLSNQSDYTLVSFTPDMSAFGAKSLDKLDAGTLDMLSVPTIVLIFE